MNLQHSTLQGNYDISSSYVQKLGISTLDVNAPAIKLAQKNSQKKGNKIERIDWDKETDLIPKDKAKDSIFDMGLPMNLGGNNLMGGDDSDSDEDTSGAFGIPESMLQSTIEQPQPKTFNKPNMKINIHEAQSESKSHKDFDIASPGL